MSWRTRMLFWDLLFSADGASGKAWRVIAWWEIRRLFFNGLVFTPAAICFFVADTISQSVIPPGANVGGPYALVGFFGVFIVLANLVYTLGWIVELATIRGDSWDHQDFRETYFRRGVVISCLAPLLAFVVPLISWLALRL